MVPSSSALNLALTWKFLFIPASSRQGRLRDLPARFPPVFGLGVMPAFLLARRVFGGRCTCASHVGLLDVLGRAKGLRREVCAIAGL